MPEASCLDAARKISAHPMNEDGHSRRFQGERQGAEDDGRKSLAEEFHSLGRYSTCRRCALGPGQDPIIRVSATAEASASEARTIASRAMREYSFLTWNAFRRRRLLVDQRELYQLHVDREAQAPVDLIEQCGFPAGKDFAKCRNVFQP